MPSISMESRPAGVLENSVQESAKLQRHVCALIVSASPWAGAG